MRRPAANDFLGAADGPEALREGMRRWLAEVLPGDWRQAYAAKSEAAYVDFQRWWLDQRRRVGIAVPGLPAEYGGAGLDFESQLIVAEELARAGAPPLEGALFMVSLTHVPATLLAWGTEAQKRTYLPGLLAGDVWCQGFSEPGAGSDLASLRTRAVRDGDHFVVDGQKTWSSWSRHARYCLLLVRTDPAAPKHKGISYLILDMASPGVEVRPIVQPTGHAEFSEVFLTEVKIPVANLIGPENEGWAVAQSTLAAERGVLAFERAERQMSFVEAFLKASLDSGTAWTRQDHAKAEFTEVYARMQGIRCLIRKLLARPHDDPSGADMLPAIIKLLATECAQHYADMQVRFGGLATQLQGHAIVCDGTVPMHDFIQSFGDTISAGSNEIMRNLIAERRLGLPRG